MHKRYTVVAVVAVVFGSACATKSKGAEPGEPDTVTMESPGAGAAEGVLCKSRLSVSVTLDSSGKKHFSPPPPSSDWQLCSTGTLTLTNDLSYPACLVILDNAGHSAVTKSVSASGGKVDVAAPSANGNPYTLGVCQQQGSDCSSGCGHMTDTQQGVGIHDTLKGNISVVTSG